MGADMKKPYLLFAAAFFAATLTLAGPKPQPGTILSQTSVACGTKKENKKTDIDLLCQQYVIRAATTDYTVRQQKPSNQSLIPLNTSVMFTVDKNKMKFKADGKSYEYLILGQAAAGTAQP